MVFTGVHERPKHLNEIKYDVKSIINARANGGVHLFMVFSGYQGHNPFDHQSIKQQKIPGIGIPKKG